MRVTLQPNESITIEYEGTDGEVKVRFDEDGTRVLVNDEEVHLDKFIGPHTVGQPKDFAPAATVRGDCKAHVSRTGEFVCTECMKTWDADEEHPGCLMHFTKLGG